MSSSSTWPLIVYHDINYGGSSVGIGYGQYANAVDYGFPNDTITSFKVAPFTKVTFFVDWKFLGSSMVVNGPAQVPYIGDTWNDKVTSIIVERVEPTDDFKMGCCYGTNDATQCGEYAQGNAQCAAVITSYCPVHLDDARCQSWCRANPTNVSQCDAGATKYCDTNPSSPFCTCIKSPIAAVINPKCANKKCADTGYVPASMQDACPNMITCAMKTALDKLGAAWTALIPLQQNCDPSLVPASTPTPITTPTPTPTTLTTPVVPLLSSDPPSTPITFTPPVLSPITINGSSDPAPVSSTPSQPAPVSPVSSSASSGPVSVPSQPASTHTVSTPKMGGVNLFLTFLFIVFAVILVRYYAIHFMVTHN